MISAFFSSPGAKNTKLRGEFFGNFFSEQVNLGLLPGGQVPNCGGDWEGWNCGWIRLEQKSKVVGMKHPGK